METTIKMYTIREDRMVDLAQLFGFDGGDARDAAYYLGSKIGCRINYNNAIENWYLYTKDFDKDPKKLTFLLLNYGHYFR